MPPAPERVQSCKEFALHFLRELNGEDVDEATIQRHCDLWGIQRGDCKSRADAVNAVGTAAGTYYWNRALQANEEYKLLTKDDKKEYMKERLVLSQRDMNTLTHEEQKEYLADKNMEKPVGAIQNIFSAARQQLKDDDMTWWHAYMHESKTGELRAEQQVIIDDDAEKGPVQLDLKPLQQWAIAELHNKDATIGTLGVAVQYLAGRRRTENCAEEHALTKHSEYEIKISHLLKRRGASAAHNSEAAVPGDIGQAAVDDTSFTILCLAPADDVLHGWERLRKLSASLTNDAYGEEVTKTVKELPVLTELREKWHFNRQFKPHNLRCVYVAHLRWMLTEAGRLPIGFSVANVIAKYLGHQDLSCTTNYNKVLHMPAASTNEEDDEELELAHLNLKMAQIEVERRKLEVKILQRKRKREVTPSV
jgi:hypothetical protein